MADDRAGIAHFGDLVRADSFDLGEAALVVASVLGHPDPVYLGLDRLDALAASVPGIDLGSVTDHLFATVGLRGDQADYYAPENSLLPAVLERRRGIPITLAIIAASVARRLGLVATVVGMPGHVLLGDGDPPMQWCDCFHGGQWLDPLGARARFAAVHGRHAPFHPRYLRATPDVAVLARLLANLVGIYEGTGDGRSLVRVRLLRAQIPGIAETERTALAVALTAVGRFGEAADQWADEARDLDGDEAEEASATADRLRANLN